MDRPTDDCTGGVNLNIFPRHVLKKGRRGYFEKFLLWTIALWICEILKIVQGGAKGMALSCEKVSARLQPATAGHARLVLSKTVSFFCTSLHVFEI